MIEELQDYEYDEIPIGTEYFEADKVDVKVDEMLDNGELDYGLEEWSL